MFDDIKPLPVSSMHQPHDFSSQERGVNNVFGTQYQHQSGMKALSQSSLTMSLRQQQQASNRQGHELHQQQEYMNKKVGQG